MMHRAWSSIVEVPYCFSRSYVKFQGRTALKIVKFDPNWAFPDSNSSLNSPMAMKCCTKLETAKERCPIVFQGHPSNFKVTGQNITDFDPNWAFPDYRPVAAFKSLRFALFHCNSRNHRARHFPLPDGPGQVKLPVGQVDLDRFFFFISYKQIEEFKNSWSRASDDFEKRRALNHPKQLIIGHRKISDVAAVLSIGMQ